MDLRVVWSPEAADDLEEIVTYIARDSGFYARAVASKLITTAESLAEFPAIGRIMREASDDSIRDRFVHSYRLIYKVEPQRILILAIVHGKRLLNKIEERLK